MNRSTEVVSRSMIAAKVRVRKRALRAAREVVRERMLMVRGMNGFWRL